MVFGRGLASAEACMTDIRLSCVQCGAGYAMGVVQTCPACGPSEGILDVVFDVAAARKTLTRDALAKRERSHWRYRELLPLADDFKPVQPDVGWTPLIEAPRLAQAIGIRRLRLKDDGRNPSGSFKDRPSSLAVAMALAQGAKSIATASTGNAASSLACSAAAAGLPCYIFVPGTVPEGKLAQLLAYGATVFKVAEGYAAAYDLCNEACGAFGWSNRNCAINPYLVEGKKTGGLEVAEQCADDPPDWVSASVGDGCSIAGIEKGLRQMREVGIIDCSARMLGVQAAGCAPVMDVWHRFESGDAGAMLRIDPKATTYADSINCPVPRNWRKAVNAVRESNGTCVSVSDEQIMAAVRETGRLTGVFAEPAAATAVAGVAEAVKQGLISRDASVVAMITGNGLKDTAGAMKAVGRAHDVKATLAGIEQVVSESRICERQSP